MNCKEAASPMPVPQTCGTTVVFHAWAMAAIFLHSVKPTGNATGGELALSARPSNKAMALPRSLPLGFQERQGWRRIRIISPFLVAALDILLNDKVALQDIQIRSLTVA